jgi:hypothetical protein
MNKQPFYHRVVVLATFTRPLSEEEFEKILKRALQEKHNGYVPGSLMLEEYMEPEPGDPADLM